MLYFLFKAGMTGLLAAAVSEIARRFPGWGGLLASLPLMSLAAAIWLYHDTGDTGRVADMSAAIMLFILPSLPLFPVLALLLRGGMAFWTAMAIVVAGTLALYALTFWAAPKFGVRV